MSPGETSSPLLRPPGPADEPECLAAHDELAADDFRFLLFWEPDMAWPDYLELLAGLADGSEVPEGLVHSAFLLGFDEGELVGRVSVRFELNEQLAAEGGHIGYGVRPGFRRRGYAAGMLRQAVALAGTHGVSRALVVCDDVNAGSAAVIEGCGGVLESTVPAASGQLIRRYWIG